MYIGLSAVRGKGKFDAALLCNPERIADPDIVRGKSHDTAQKGAVRSVPAVCSGKGAVKCEFRFFQYPAVHFLCKKRDSAGSGGV